MFRVFSALFLSAMVAVAAPVPPPKPTEVVSAAVTVATVTLKDGVIVHSYSYTYQEAVMTPVTTMVNGQPVTTYQTQMIQKNGTKENKWKLKEAKATGTDGKAIDTDDLEKKLKDGGVVVTYTGGLSEEARKVFKDGTIFLPVSTSPAAPVAPAPPGTGGPALPPAPPK